VDEHDWLAERFEGHRAHLRAVAYRMLGSSNEADDAVQEAWLRLARSDANEVENLGGWLTTVVARVCLDMLRTRRSRREEPLGAQPDEPVAGGVDPEQQAVLADSVGPALLLVLDTLAPAERLAFVLHDMFAVPFEEIAPIVGRSPAAARQLASRGRRRVRGAAADPGADLDRQRQVVKAFLAASRDGDFDALLAVLDPDVVLRADHAAVRGAEAGRAHGAPELSSEARGVTAVAGAFLGRAQAAQPALVDGAVGVAWAPGGQPRAVYHLVISAGRIVAIEVIADPARVRELDVVLLDR
jgi:RNA polymerase sigma-70 factor (ECF subfamily)